ncbi:7,8-dihydropterin-6-yl-methyl-4-(beta-D-ribofuranosyl)aminobenzene 5'-phosphate synthase [[Clostridium] fimetarium]|uniref:7,8-dihydropterin-6-yl-methyl-4-(Beta-D-ribofuranosyl)aminobenzene 5'-phosphate synthase n=2 Tax=[Clostridium] fimetarium TaxID=99656 RepID=A0A1I0RTI3_9FIRM|nr:7,8-dihydropterin-6-yl-methyl-4-(beta-D-ribofuranosyl)aminobenzene 5'-phosphate synthase [[Clostridium] fimetarium]
MGLKITTLIENNPDDNGQLLFEHIIVGCSHIGIVNIMKTISERINIPIYAVIGGTHLIEADEVRMKKTIDAFNEMKIQLVAVSHCTGEEGICLISQEMKEQYLYNNTGKVIEI